MSYLTDLRNGLHTPIDLFKRSAGWLARQAGLDDHAIDKIVKDADAATDNVVPMIEAALNTAIGQSFPVLPAIAREVIAHRVAVAALEMVDTAIGAAGAVLKANN